MKQRVISAVIGALILFAVLAVGATYPAVFYIGLAAVAAVAAHEVNTATGCQKAKPLAVASVLFAALVPLAPLVNAAAYPILPTVFTVYLFFVFAYQLFHHEKVAFVDVLANVCVCTLVSASLCCLARIRANGGAKESIFLILLVLIMAWTSDMGAYFVGRKWGKRPLAPAISPKKTKEGFWGGIISCIVCTEAAAALFFFFAQTGMRVNFLTAAIAAAIGSAVSVLGDLSFSLLKRHYGIKDFGRIMPGHGGVLDRFDSVIFVAPFLYLFMQYLPIIHA